MMGWLNPSSSAFALPGTRVKGIVLPLLAASNCEHNDAKNEHNETPPQVHIHPHRADIDSTVPRDNAPDGHHATGNRKDEAERDANVESHGCSNRCLGEDEVEDDQHRQ